MAQGDFTLFTAAKAKLANGTFDMNDDTWKLALITGSITPSAGDTDPCWGTNGSPNTATDFSAYEAVGGSPQGTYTAGGKALTTVTWTESGGTVTLAADPVTFAQDAANPTDALLGHPVQRQRDEQGLPRISGLGRHHRPVGGWFQRDALASGILTLA